MGVIWKRIASAGLMPLVLAVGMGALVASELVLRFIGFGDPPLYVFDDEIEYYLAPDRTYKRFGETIRVNRHGMRSDDVDFSRIERQFVFSIYGDSIVYGQRLDQADTPPAQLQRMLRSRTAGAVSIVNGVSAPSWGPENLLYFYNRFGPFPGNTAWIVQSTHDMIDVTHQPHEIIPYRRTAPYGALHDFAFLAWSWARQWVLARGSYPDSFQDNRRRADAALDGFIRALKKDYARVVLVFHATKEEALGGKTDGLDHYRVVAKSHNIAFISMLDVYRLAYASGRRPHYDDIHLSRDGAEILAAQLLTVLP